MDLAIISPPKMLELSSIVDKYHMVLPEYMGVEDYVRTYKSFDGFKILDNGAAEGVQYSAIDLHRMAEEVGAQCIVAHDVLGDAHATISSVRDFSRYVDRERSYMGVLQGRTLAEFLTCYNFYTEACPWMDTLGIPRLMTSLHPMARIKLAESLRLQMMEGKTRKMRIHALGAGAIPQEITPLSNYVDGMDTSLPVVYGLKGMRIEQNEGIFRDSDFSYAEVPRTDPRYSICLDNVLTYYRWAGIDVIY